MQHNKTKHGMLSTTYIGQCSSTVKHPDYTRDELISWAHDQQLFHDLYAAWSDSGYLLALRPVCDRTDPRLPYTFSNMTLMTHAENAAKNYSDRAKGLYPTAKNCPVIQLTLNNEYMAEYPTMTAAAKAVSRSTNGIRAACKGDITKCAGYHWRFK